MTKISVLLAFSWMLTSCINPLSVWFPPDVSHVLETDASGGQVITIYVAPWGSDSGSSSKVKPLKTLQGAINRSRVDYREDNLAKKIRIYVAGGTFEPGKGLPLEANYGVWVSSTTHLMDSFYDTEYEISFGWDMAFQAQSNAHPTLIKGKGAYGNGAVVFVDGVNINSHVQSLGDVNFAGKVGGAGPVTFPLLLQPGYGFRVQFSGPLEIQP